MNTNQKRAIVAVIGITLLFGGLYVTFGVDSPEVYQYDVKTEQVQSDSATVNETTAIEDLDREGAIFKAWKKSDHFLGSSSTQIETDERLELDQEDRWQVVEIDGVRMLVGIQGPESYKPATVKSLFGVISTMFGAMLLVFLPLIVEE